MSLSGTCGRNLSHGLLVSVVTEIEIVLTVYSSKKRYCFVGNKCSCCGVFTLQNWPSCDLANEIIDYRESDIMSVRWKIVYFSTQIRELFCIIGLKR